ncbi:MAG: hypothetical protein PWQ54_1269 [Bacteroidales bacterium]|jgi:hypothetical protein|nr:hypothetical protein [Bacteroidales bacterium]
MNMNIIITKTVITCPTCGFKKEETMPEDSCQSFLKTLCKTGDLVSDVNIPIQINIFNKFHLLNFFVTKSMW